MDLNNRKIKILQAIIHDYIETAEPVGSRTLSKKYSLGVSPATIRNEMSDLEELGYLTQPHTSAGRIPSDKGYRLYVDNLMEIKMIADLQRKNIQNNLLRKFGEVEQLLQYSSKIISQLTNYTSAVLTPQIKENKIKRIQLVPIDQQSIIAVMVTDTGIIKNPLVNVKEGINSDQLEKVSNLLNQKLQGMTISDIENQMLQILMTELSEFNSIIESVAPKIFSALEAIEDAELFLSGTTNIFNFPEFNDVFKAKSFLKMLEEKQTISSIISSSREDGINISIGSENIYQEAKECSLVTATYKVDGVIVGRLSVIGPTRMDYSNVVGVMNQISQYINELLRTRYR
ncbi:heat-inducible transcriptional repressor HrcA [Clostridium formicaceticum]|uniref:Heat-inducible transcription repressor HrcA n=1 Tax=Clostridium formicaceticum TaxID=1497 RepID=A0AAC9RNF1_9CLOT|nr:heat-inducible transcriptional repressor HrcA [Clostridium formicaceticum]AOY77570.1 heat-inducible transcription repressor HrcA [Clostridium formicaceticum]ARE88148.1 Heat-inducible transcription repressor HrcA [Clostridium formicaceticum]